MNAPVRDPDQLARPPLAQLGAVLLGGEGLGVQADPLDVGVPGDHPDLVDQVGIGDPLVEDRGVPAQERELVVRNVVEVDVVADDVDAGQIHADHLA
jgi:hypothetical protein